MYVCEPSLENGKERVECLTTNNIMREHSIFRLFCQQGAFQKNKKKNHSRIRCVLHGLKHAQINQTV